MTRDAFQRLAAIVLLGALTGACATAAQTRPAPFPRAATVGSTGDIRGASLPEAAPSVGISASASRLIASAVALIGTRYQLGGQSPESGFDCSGLVSYVAAQNGLALPRTAAQQYGAGRAIDRDELATGDLVFFSTIGPGATHVGIVIVADDELKFVHAPADGASVRIERLDSPYWQRRWVGARRILTD